MAIRLSELLAPDRIRLDTLARDKAGLFEALAALIHQAIPSIGSQAAREVLVEREKLASTGIGEGIAVPHGKLAGIEEPTAFLITVPGGVAFDAVDGRPVELVLALLSPLSAVGDQLKALAKASRCLRDLPLRRKLLAASSPADAYDAIRAYESTR